MVDRDRNFKLYLYPNETAKAVEGFEDYLVTDTGRVLSTKKRVRTTTLEGKTYEAIIYRELKATLVRGYKTVTLSDKKKRKNCYIHELVFKTFIGEYDKCYFKIKHINQDKLDNSLENLKLEFRKKDSKFIEKYVYQNKILDCLNEY